jgi:magnesium transporter
VTHGVACREDIRALELAEVHLFIGRNYVVTIHHGQIPAMEEAFHRWLGSGQLMREGVGFLVYCVLDAVIDAYFPVMEAIEDDLDETELRMFAGSYPSAPQDLMAVKRTLFTLRRVLSPLRETFGTFLRREHPFFSPGTFVYFQDVYDHVLRLLDLVEMERERLAGALDAHMTALSTELNTRMKTLTVLAVVVGLVGCVLDAWGMGLGGTPFLQAPWAFWGVVALNGVLVVGILIVSWRKGWL